MEKMVVMLGQYILVVRDKPVERKSPGGIHLPAQAASADLMSWATVRAVGPDVGATVRDGDRILVGRYTGSDVKIQGEDAVVVRLEDVFGVERESLNIAKDPDSNKAG